MTAAPPQVWLLTDNRPGNRTQVLGTARALGWPAVEKRLVFGWLSHLPTPLLGGTLKVLDAQSRASLTAPWPDLLIAAGRRAVPVARSIQQASNGRTRVVLLGRKTPTDFADLTIRCTYFRQPPTNHLVEVALPPTEVDAAELAHLRETGPDPLAGLERPCCVALIGGPTRTHVFDAIAACQMAADLAGAAEAAGVSLAIVTSRRTPKDAVAAIRGAAPTAFMHEWTIKQTYNPYRAFLAHADLLAVTGESESMLADAVRATRPLTIYPLKTRRSAFGAHLSNWVASKALSAGFLAGPARWLMKRGWVTPRRDLADLHRMIENRGWGRLFHGALNLEAPEPYSDDQRMVGRIRALFP